jgi:hypothetical protein
MEKGTRVAGPAQECEDSKDVPEMTFYPGKHLELDQERMADDVKSRIIKTSPILPTLTGATAKGAGTGEIDPDEMRLLGAFLWTCAVAASLVGVILYAMLIHSGL